MALDPVRLTTLSPAQKWMIGAADKAHSSANERVSSVRQLTNTQVPT